MEIRSVTRFCSLFFALAVMAGCVRTETSEVVARSDPAPAARTPAETAGPTPPEMPVPSKRPPRPVVSVPPTKLVGNSESQLVDLLGRPASVRDEPPAMVWQYVSSTCKVDVFFYFDVKTQDFRSLAYKFYPNGGKAKEDGECLYQLQANARTDRKRDR